MTPQEFALASYLSITGSRPMVKISLVDGTETNGILEAMDSDLKEFIISNFNENLGSNVVLRGEDIVCIDLNV